MTGGMITGGWNFVVAAYVLTALVLTALFVPESKAARPRPRRSGVRRSANIQPSRRRGRIGRGPPGHDFVPKSPMRRRAKPRLK